MKVLQHTRKERNLFIKPDRADHYYRHSLLRMTFLETQALFSNLMKYSLLLAFFMISVTWLFQCNVSVMVTPNTLKLLTKSRSKLLIEMGAKDCLIFLKSFVSSLHLSTLSWSLLQRDQRATVSTPSFLLPQFVYLSYHIYAKTAPRHLSSFLIPQKIPYLNVEIFKNNTTYLIFTNMFRRYIRHRQCNGYESLQ